MVAPRVFISYAKEAPNDSRFAMRLTNDLRGAGADVVTIEESQANKDGSANECFEQMLNRKLPSCEWMILVQTPDALHSAHVQMAVNTALNLVVQQRMRGVLAMIAVPGNSKEMPPTWTTLKTFDASQDYPRALARILLTIDLASPTSLHKAQAFVAPQPTLQPASQLTSHRASDKPLPPSQPHTQRRLRTWILSLSMILVVVFATVLIYFIKSVPTRRLPTPAISMSTATPPPTLNATDTATPAPTLNATATTFATSPQGLYNRVAQGQPVLDDPLSNQDNNNWQVGTSTVGNCTFLNGAYSVNAIQANHRMTCIDQNSSFSNFAFQVQMTFVSGGPCGILFRDNGQKFLSDRLYLYSGGFYELYKVNDARSRIRKLAQGSATISPNQPNTLAVIAIDNMLYVYINRQFVASVYDTPFTVGGLGMLCKNNSQPSKALFRFAKVWEL